MAMKVALCNNKRVSKSKLSIYIIDGTKYGPGISAYQQQKNKRRNNLSSVINTSSPQQIAPLSNHNMPLTPPNGITVNVPGSNNSLFLPPMAHQMPGQAPGGPMSAGGQGLEFNGQK